MKQKLNLFFNGYENPTNKYEECPFIAWCVFAALFLVIILGCYSVFFL